MKNFLDFIKEHDPILYNGIPNPIRYRLDENWHEFEKIIQNDSVSKNKLRQLINENR